MAREQENKKENLDSSKSTGNNSQRNRNRNMRGRQGRKDSSAKRINDDNERASKFSKACNSANDPSWYAGSPELMKAAASLPFSQTTGSSPLFGWDFAPGGLLSLEFSPTIGGLYTDPVNQAANMMYTYTVHANSRNKSYDAPDEMLLVIAASQLFAAIAMGVRAYGVTRYYTQQNSYVPDALLQAMGFYPRDLRSQMAKMWFDLNLLIEQSKQIWVPTDMPIFQRWFWLNTNVYTDAEGPQAQMYVFVQRFFYQYVEGPSSPDEGVGALIPYQWINDAANGGNPILKTWDEYMTMMNTLMSSLINSQDRGIIFGDILKAYGERIFTMNPIDASYTVTPTYVPEVLTQIENCTLCKMFPTGIHQNMNAIDNRLYETYGAIDEAEVRDVILPSTAILNFHQTTDPSPEQIMVATRLQAHGLTVQKQGDVVQYYPNSSGTEIVYKAIMWFRAGAKANFSIGGWPVDPVMTVTRSAGLNLFPTQDTGMSGWELGKYLAFDWSPWIYVYETAALDAININNPGVYNIEPFFADGDYDKYTLLSEFNAKQMHQTAIYSLFGVPKIGQ